MIDEARLETLTGATVYGSDQSKIGKVEAVYLDDDTNRPEWVAVTTGMFGKNVSFVPIEGASMKGDDVLVPFDKDTVKGSPNFGADAHLSHDEEAELYTYYGRGYDTGQQSTGRTQEFDTSATTTGRDTSGPTTDDAMTRSEERLRVGTEDVEAGRARLRKYVVTENVTQTVPVRREQVRVEREPITDGNVDQAMDGPAISEEEHEVTLREERPVVATEAVPVERVRLSKDTRVDEETVSADVRKEQIESDGVYPDETTSKTTSEQRRNR